MTDKVKTAELFILGATDALLALLNVNDANNEKANKYVQELTLRNAKVFFSTLTITEALNTLIEQNDNPDLLDNLISNLTGGNISILPVDAQIVANATKYFHDIIKDKKTFSHAITCTVTENGNMDGIFSFDEWYKTKGFKLVGDLL